MQRELSKYFVSLVKLFLHTIFRTNGLKIKYQKCQIYTTLEKTTYSRCSHVTTRVASGVSPREKSRDRFTIKLFWFAVGVSIHRG